MSYAALGLRRNPFAVDLDPEGTDALFLPHPAVAAPSSTDELVQILGPRGAGKTTQIRHWRQAWPGPYLHVDHDRARWRRPPVATIAYWDEADRIPLPVAAGSLIRARRRGAVIVAATHEDLSGAARLAGVSIRTVVLPEPTSTRVMDWAQRHIERASAGPPTLEVHMQLAESVVKDCGGSWRVIGDRLHSWVARQARAVDQPMSSVTAEASASDKPRQIGS